MPFYIYFRLETMISVNSITPSLSVLLLFTSATSTGPEPTVSDLQSQNELTASQEFLCRGRGHMLPLDYFQLESCALCYYYMQENQFKVNGIEQVCKFCRNF